MHDVILIGGGPAGLSAALTLRARGKSVLLISNDPLLSPLAKAERVDNYPGLPNITGRALLERLTDQARAAGVDFTGGRALAVMPAGNTLSVSVGQEVCNATALILCVGVSRGKPLPGEMELLGAGVSYCTTCDGMLYRNRDVAVLGFTADANLEVEFLQSIGCRVRLLNPSRAKHMEILGTDRVRGIRLEGMEIACDGVFVLRDTIMPAALVPGLDLDGSHIRVRPDMSTSVPGVFAAGDCVGAPYQVAKAVGDGNVAALSAAKYIDRLQKEHSERKEN